MKQAGRRARLRLLPTSLYLLHRLHRPWPRFFPFFAIATQERIEHLASLALQGPPCIIAVIVGDASFRKVELLKELCGHVRQHDGRGVYIPLEFKKGSHSLLM